MPFDVEAARKQNIPDDQIANRLIETRHLDGPKMREAGLTDQQIIEHYSQLDPAPVAEKSAPKEQSLGSAAMSGVEELIPSLGRQAMGAVQGVAQAVTSPIETAKGVGKLAVGAAESIPNIFGAGTDRKSEPTSDLKKLVGLPDTEFEKEARKMFGSMAHNILDKYGSWKKFKDVLATDPGQFVMDAVAFLPGGAAGRTAQTVAKIPGAAKAAELATKIPGIAKAGEALKGGIKEIPGVDVILHERRAKEMEAISGKYSSSEDVEELFKAAKEEGGVIDTSSLKQKAVDLWAKNEELPLRSEAVQKDLKQISEMPKEMNPEDFHKVMQFARELKEKAKKEIAGESQYKELYSAFHETLDEAEKGTKGAALKKAIVESRKDFNAEYIHDIMSDAVSAVKGKGEEIRANPASVLNKLDDKKVKKELISRIGEPEYNAIKDTMKRLNVFPSGIINPATGMAVGGYIGYMAGRGKGGAIGGAIGMMAPSIISKAVLSPAGRKIVNKMLDENKGTLTRGNMQRLLAFVSEQESAQDTQPKDLNQFWK